MFRNGYRLPFRLAGIPLYLDISFLLILPLMVWLTARNIAVLKPDGRLVNIAFLVTPVFWYRQMLAERAYLVDLNPLHAFLECLRSPLLGPSIRTRPRRRCAIWRSSRRRRGCTAKTPGAWASASRSFA